MIAFADLAGQSALIGQLQSDFARGRYVHAYLLTGPGGTGKRSAAQLCAMAALCRGEKKPCGACGPCRRVLSGTHPDVHTVVPEKGKQIIGVGVMREVLDTVSVKSFEDGAKVILIPQAERMNAAAQNCLLKTLEEPPERTVFFLITDQPAALLPTIVSRCQTLHLKLTPRDEVLEDCKKAGIDEKDAELLSFLANDLAFIQEGVKSKTYQNAKMAFEEIVSSLQKGLPEARFAAENVVIPLLKERPVLKEFLEFLTLFYEDVLAWKYGTPLKLASYGKMSRAVLEKTDDPKKALLSVMNARQEADTNINGGLLLLHMLHQFKEE